MELVKGQLVTHPKKPAWGTGEVLANSADHKVRVHFSEAGYKLLDLGYVDLVLVKGTPHQRPRAASFQVLPQFDQVKVRKLCERFVLEMRDNRSNVNDGGMAEEVLKDLDSRSSLRKSTVRRLAAWCTTEGTVFQRGVSIAQDISLELFGRVILRDDVK
jgi:hypothetical protein